MKALIAHETLHLFGFDHTNAGIMSIPIGGITALDRENFALYRALPNQVTRSDLRERACIGSNGVCERMYGGG